MNLSWQRIALPLKDPFTISRGTIRHQNSLIVSLSDGQQTGYGEATCNAYYGHTYESLERSLEKLVGVLEVDVKVCPSPENLHAICQEVIPDDPFIQSAIDCAGYDLFGKIHGRTSRQLLGIPESVGPRSSYTLGIDSIDEMIRKYRAQPGWPVYKVKLGTPHDLDIVRALRNETSAVIRVDANCAWTPKQAVEYSHVLARLGVEFIEQPLPATSSDDERKFVFENSALPIIADESCRTEADVDRCAGLFHGVNVKLVKCGGLTPAARMLRRARELGMRTMVGCMIESSVGISAAAQLLPLLDYADLDGATLLAMDPASGVRIVDGEVTFSEEFGSGIEFHPERFDLAARGD